MPATELLSSIVSDCRDAARVNSVVNDPSVRPYIGAPDAGALDMEPLLADVNNLFPFGEHGGFALIWTAPKTYEVHTFILPAGRGAWARAAAAAGIEMAVDRGARMLWTRVPDNAAHVHRFAAEMGMAPTGETSMLFSRPYEVMAMEVPSCQ